MCQDLIVCACLCGKIDLGHKHIDRPILTRRLTDRRADLDTEVVRFVMHVVVLDRRADFDT